VLLIAETWDPGWSGAVNGGSIALQRRQEISIGAHVGPGSGTLELRYRPRGLAAGAVMSAVGVAALALAALRQRSRRGATS
jgi:uncharacterized membrane protein YfhO